MTAIFIVYPLIHFGFAEDNLRGVGSQAARMRGGWWGGRGWGGEDGDGLRRPPPSPLLTKEGAGLLDIYENFLFV